MVKTPQRVRFAALAAALSVFSALSAHAVGRNVSVTPLISVLNANPTLLGAVRTETLALAGMSPLAISQVSLAAPAATLAPAAALQVEARRIAFGLAQPDLLAVAGPELARTLGSEEVGALRAVAIASPETPLGRKVQEARDAVDLVHAGGIAALQDRLSRLYEGSRGLAASGAALEVVDEGKRGKPIVSLAPSGRMDAAALQAYMAQPGRTIISPRGMKRATFDSGDFNPAYEGWLKAQGYDYVTIKNPSRAEFAANTEDEGWELKPETIRWVMPAPGLEPHFESIGKGSANKIRKELEKSAHLVIERGPLTVAAYEEWYPIYEDEVVGKPGGKRNVHLDFARKKMAEQGNLDTWYGVFYRDPATGRMVGGVIMKEWKERGMFVLGYAAYRPETKPFYMSVRTFAEGMNLATARGLPVLSFGQDTNLFGYDYSLGLMQNKVRFRLTPYPEEPLVLLKVLDPAKFMEDRDSNGKQAGYFFFGLKRDSEVAQKHLAARDAKPDAEAPEPWELLNSRFYFTPEMDQANKTLAALQFYGDDVKVSTPEGIDVVRRPARKGEPPTPR